jgi:cytoskeletal protein CcmA (bactofilin family)
MFSRGAKGLGGGAAAGAGEFSFLGAEVQVTGDIDTPGQIHLDGKVTGDVRCGTLVQGTSGEVRGNIVAAEARIAGLVDGAIEAGTLSLDHSARVTGDMLYETLSIAGGAEVEGRFKRRKGAGDGSGPARAKAAETATPAPLFAHEPPTAEAAE